MNQSYRGENEPMSFTIQPEEPTREGQNEDNLRYDQNVLCKESPTEPIRLSACGQNAPSVQGKEMQAATYVAGNEARRTSTNEHFYMADSNDMSNLGAAYEHFVSDTIRAENSIMYASSGEHNEDAGAIGNFEQETQVTQADSSLTMNSKSNMNANKSQPDTTGEKGDNKTRHEDLSDRDIEPFTVENIDEEPKAQTESTVTDDGMIEPYAVTNMLDNETYQSTTTNVEQQASDNSSHDTAKHKQKFENPPDAGESTVTDDGMIEPYAVTNMLDNETYQSTTTDVEQQASDNSSHDTAKHVRKVENPQDAQGPNPQQANKRHGKDSPMEEVNNATTLNATEVTNTSIATISTSDGTNPPIGGTDGTNSPILGGINGTNPPIFGGINGTNPPSLGGSIGTKPPSRKETACEERTMRLACAANEVIVVHNAFYGRRAKSPRCGCRLRSCNKCEKFDNRPYSDILSAVREDCQGLQQCGMRVKFVDRCPGIKKYLEATYHCEAERKESVTFGGRGNGRGQFQSVRGLAVSSTNEIFVTEESNRRIQVFNMRGSFLRSFRTGNMKPRAISTGRNDTLWVVLYGGRYDSKRNKNAIHQYSKDGDAPVAKFICRGTPIQGIAWHEVSHRIILTMPRDKKSMWFSPTYTQTQTCNMKMFGSTGLLPLDVTVDKEGNIYITDSDGSHVLKYDKNGVYLFSFGSPGSGAGDLYNPFGICVDSLGRVFVADTGNSRVEMFTAEGDHIRTVAYINKPQHVATGGEGQLVVSNEDQFITILPKY
ncbi:hypothetical protein Bbelb_352250 [Branchiostoma belcheri]|nr:hypothetical protein Bbelb_352250 [Branchiostoma belcheri]